MEYGSNRKSRPPVKGEWGSSKTKIEKPTKKKPAKKPAKKTTKAKK